MHRRKLGLNMENNRSKSLRKKEEEILINDLERLAHLHRGNGVDRKIVGERILEFFRQGLSDKYVGMVGRGKPSQKALLRFSSGVSKFTNDEFIVSSKFLQPVKRINRGIESWEIKLSFCYKTESFYNIDSYVTKGKTTNTYPRLEFSFTEHAVARFSQRFNKQFDDFVSFGTISEDVCTNNFRILADLDKDLMSKFGTPIPVNITNAILVLPSGVFLGNLVINNSFIKGGGEFDLSKPCNEVGDSKLVFFGSTFISKPMLNYLQWHTIESRKKDGFLYNVGDLLVKMDKYVSGEL